MPKRLETIAIDARGAARDWLLTIVQTPHEPLYRKSFALHAAQVQFCRQPCDDPDALILHDPGVSQERCALERSSDGSYVCVDRGSRNTPRVNGTRLTGRRPLKANDVLRVGDTLMIIEKSDLSRRNANTRDQPELLKRLCMFESTAASILDLETSFFDPDAMCVAIQAEGFAEARVAATWLAEQHDVKLALVDAEMGNVIGTLKDPAPDTLVVVERLDVLDSSADAAAIAEAIEQRVNGLNPRRVAFSYAEAAPKSQIQRLMETAAESALTIPPLTERRSDILAGLRHMIGELSDVEFTFPPICAEKLLCYSWPAGLAELKRIARRLHRNIIEDGEITRVGLTAEIRAIDLAPDSTLSNKLTKESFELAFREFNGKVVDVADHFGYNRGYFYRRLKKEGINVADYRVGTPEDDPSDSVDLAPLEPEEDTQGRDPLQTIETDVEGE